MKNRNHCLDVVRCIGNYLIVLMHAGAALQYCKLGGAEINVWTFICGCLTPMALPSLFLISGYLLFINYSFQTYPQKVVRRVKRLFIPYIFWNITFVIFYLLVGNFVPRLGTRVASFDLNSFEGAFSKILDLTTHPIDGPLWFIRTLFVLSILSPILFLIIRNEKKIIRYSGLLLIFIAYFVFYKMELMKNLLMTYPLYSITLFYIGGIMAKENVDLAKMFKSIYWLVPCIVSICVLAVVVYNPQQANTVLFATLEDVGKLLYAPALFFIVSRLNTDTLVTNNIFSFAKEMSFFAYAGHFLFCSMIMHTIAPLLSGLDNGKATILIFVFCFLGIPIMAVIYTFGKRFVPRIMKVYDGSL